MKYIKSFDDFINESQINEMGMAVRNANVQAQMDNIMSKYNLVLNPETGRYDCNGDVKVSADLVSSDGKFIIQFGVVGGHFDCSSNKLTSLEGAPQEVGGDFFCYGNKLTSLEGVPEKVSGDFDCSYNELTSLKGAPLEVGGVFNCESNKLTSLEGAPQEVGGDFYCNYNKLTSLEGAPQKVGGSFDCTKK